MLGLLSPESDWLTYLMVTQLVKVVIFAVWQLKLLEREGIESMTPGYDSGKSNGISYRNLKRFHSEYR